MNNTRGESSAPVARIVPDLVQAATIEELREMVNKMWSENLKLEAIASEARMSAAHYKLHYNLLSIESQEALNRMEVENYMFRREAEIMRHNPLDPAQLEYNKKLKEYCKSLKEDHLEFQRRLKKAKNIIKVQDGRLFQAQQVISLLQERIRANRKHFTEMRNAGGPLHENSTLMTQPPTPRMHCCSSSRRNSTPNDSQSLSKHHESSCDSQENLNVLLLAGSILNQENKSRSSSDQFPSRVPHTSKILNQKFPSTFQAKSHGNSRDINAALLPPVQFTPEVEARMKFRTLNHTQAQKRRRKSRDSTISASDTEEISPYQTTSNYGDQFGVDESKLYKLRAGLTAPTEYNKKSDKILPIKLAHQVQDSIHSSRLIAAAQKRKRDEDLTKWENERKKGKSRDRVELKIGC